MQQSGDRVAGSATARSRRHWLAAARALAVVLAGCAGPAGSPSAAGTAAGLAGTVRPTAVRPADRRDDTDVSPVEPAVVEAYRRFWTVVDGLGGQPVARWRVVLSTVAVEPLLSRLYDGYQEKYRAGVGEYGVVRPRPAVVGVRGGRASVVDCQDASMSGEIDTDTGMPRTVGRARTPVAATLVRGADGVWRLSDARYLDGSC